MHVLIVGMTLSGKTTLAKKLARISYNNGRGIFVLDALRDPQWKEAGADFVTDDPATFLHKVKLNRNCTLFIDEAGNYCGQYDKDAWWLATQARHWGHKSVFISQRANMIGVNIRDNCSELFCFRVSPNDSKLLADSFCDDSLLYAHLLEKGEALHIKRFSKPQIINVFTGEVKPFNVSRIKREETIEEIEKIQNPKNKLDKNKKVINDVSNAPTADVSNPINHQE